MVALCVCLALAAAFVLLLPRIKALFPAARYPTPTREQLSQTLSEGDPAAIATIRIQHAAGDGYTLECKDGVPYLRRDGALLDLNDAVSEQLMEMASRVVVADQVTPDAEEVREHLPDMGLSPAQTVVTVTWADGGQTAMEIGQKVPDTAYVYFRWSEAAGVYMCDAGVGELFAMTENRLLPVRQPSLARALVDSVKLTNGNGAMEISLAVRADGTEAGTLLSPFVYPLDGDSVSALLDCLDNLRLGTAEGPLTEENRARYGFDSPLCVADIRQRAGEYADVDASGQLTLLTAEEQSLRFTFGRAEGTYFYTCLYEGDVYLVSRFLAETLVQGGASKWITRRPADMGAELSALTVFEGERVLAVLADRRERVLPNNQLETDEQGNVLYDTAITLNGQPMTQEALDALTARLNALTVSGDVPEGWTPGDAAPRWRMTLKDRAGNVRVIAAYALDAFSDALAVDGVIRHYVYVEALDTALGEVGR